MLTYKDVPVLVTTLIKEGGAVFNRLRIALKQLPKAKYYLWFNPKTQVVFLSMHDAEDTDIVKDYIDALHIKGIKAVKYEPETSPKKETGPWIQVKEASLGAIAKPIAWAGGWHPDGVAKLFGGPNPLSATIASGALGAGAGYLTGMGIEHFAPGIFEKGKLRKTLGVLGGLGGALPGAMTGINNMYAGNSWLDPVGAAPKPGYPDPLTPKSASAISFINDILDNLASINPSLKPYIEKYADAYFTSGVANFNVREIDKDRFNRAVWDDPYLPDVYKGMTSGVLEGASQISNTPKLVSLGDIVNLGVGAGSGYVAGRVVAGTLGALAGITPQAKDMLQRAGIFAGLIKNTIPMLF